MIRPIDIRLNAAHPDLPLAEAVTYTGAPSTVLIRGVPGNCGRWAITAVFVAATFPDGSTTTRTAVQSANGVWVATLPATATSGRTAHGLRILADGADENGEAVTGYVLGVADFAVASLDVTPAPQPGETSWQMLYFDAVPGVLRKGDVTKIDGVLKLYNGNAWEPFAAPVTFDDAVTRTSANGVKSSGIWSALWGAIAALPTGFTSLYDWCMTQLSRKANLSDINGLYNWCVNQLAGKASTADATLTERFSAWTLSGDVEAGSQYEVRFDYDNGGTTLWGLYKDGDLFSTGSDNPLSTSEDFHYGLPGEEYTITATRTALSGYQLGSQSDKPLASEAEAEALRTGKQNALTAQQLANISAVSDALAFDATHTYAAGDPVVYNGTLYTFTAAHTGAWTGSDVSAVDIIARLAGKLDKSGGTMTGALHIRYGLLYVESTTGDAQYIVDWMSAFDAWALKIKPENSNTPYFIIFPNTGGTLALTAGTGHTGNLAALDANGNPTDAGWTAGDLARYSLTTKTISNGAVTLDDRAINAVAVDSTLASLTINFPTATSGKVRDFALRLNIAAGVTAPEISWPQGVTLENDGGEVPEIADGGTGGSSTILYFSETENNGTTAKFLVKGETLTAITQA